MSPVAAGAPVLPVARRRRRAAVLALATCGVVAGAGPGPVPAAAGAELNRAAVIVDTGTSVKTVCVRFVEESITGVEALQRAAVDPVLRAFPGKGAAVCSLCGTGCAGDESCLTCDPDGRFWSYSRAPAGTTSLRVSGAGASNTVVRDGDVEGWIWGRGGAPGLVAVEVVCGEAAPATTTTSPPATSPPTALAPTTTTAAVAAAGSAAPATTTARRGATTTVPAAAPQPSVAPDPAAPATVGSPPTGPGAPAPGGVAASRPGRDEGGTGWGGLAAFGAGMGGLVAWAVALRRRRRPR